MSRDHPPRRRPVPPRAEGLLRRMVGADRLDGVGADPGGELFVDAAFRVVAVAFRVVGTGWLVSLAVLQVAVGAATRPQVVGGAAALAVGWCGLTVALARRGADPADRLPASRLVSPWWLALDGLVAAAMILGPALAGEPVNFAGGYPFSAVVLALWARGPAGGFAMAAWLAAVTLVRVGPGGLDALPASAQNTLVYLVGTAVLAWALDLLRANEQRRVAAEAALAEERAQRARSEERAETAAHLHDSVLQTLALIQRQAGQAGEVRSLARRQERDLRAWLFGPQRDGGSLAAALRRVADEVGERHGIDVEVVTVGTAELDADADALVSAAREALVNAAKHAHAAKVSVYAEVAEDALRVFVRDRGVGFDPERVARNRYGLRHSVQQRMARHGGTAEVRSAPGKGTEIRLTLPRARPAPPEPAPAWSQRLRERLLGWMRTMTARWNG